MTTSDSLRQQLSDQAAHIAQALATAQVTLGRRPPDWVEVDQWRLLALPYEDDARRQAESVLRSVDSIPAEGRGFDVWNASPGLIKFMATPALAAGYHHTGDDAYAQAFRRLLEDFMLSLQPPKWAGGGMRLSQRIGRWARFLPYFLDSDAFDDTFLERVFACIPVQLASILKTQKLHARGNIRLLETEGLFWVGIGMPMLDGADAALARARWVWADTARRGVYEDGSYCEYDPNYHDVFQRTFSDVLLWRHAFPELDLPDVRQTGARVFDYAVASRSPIGHACGIQESPSPWIAARDCSEILQRRADIRRLAGLPDTGPPPLVHPCLNASQVFLRDGWEREAMFAAFDASRWGGAHSHLARNSVLLYRFGRALLADTGSLTYAMDQKAHEGDAFDHLIGPYGKSTRAHNTLNLNGWNQATTNPDALTVHTGAGLTAVYSKYSGGYWPGSYGWWFRDGYGAGIHAEHERLMIWVPGRFIVVVDRMMRWDETVHGHDEQQNPSLEMNWQLSPGGQVALSPAGDGFTARYPEGGLLGHFAKLAAGMQLSLHEGESEPPRGWVTTRTKARGDLRRYGALDDPKLRDWLDRTYVPAPQVAAVAAPMQGFGEGLVSVFVPFAGDQPPELNTELIGPISQEFAMSMAGSLRLSWADGSSDVLAWSDALAGPLLQVDTDTSTAETDGCLLHLRREGEGRAVSGTALDASYARLTDGTAARIDMTSSYHGY